MVKYVKEREKVRKCNDDDEKDEPIKWSTNSVMAGLIEIIHGVTNIKSIIKNALKVHIKRV